MGRRGAGERASPPDGGLERLTAVEARAAAELATAERDAAAILARADDALAELRARHELDRRRTLEGIRQSLTEENERTLAALTAEQRRCVARYDAVTGARLDELAEWLVQRLLRAVEEGHEPGGER